MKKIAAYCLGFIGFLMQGGAVVGLPVYVIFFGGSALWLLAFFPLGFAGMVPLALMKSMLDSADGTKLFQPAEVKSTIAEIDLFLNQHAQLCRDIIREETVGLANITDKTLHAIRSNGVKPDQLALSLITNVLARHLASGEHHVYRGMLGIIGSDMLRLISVSVSAMHERGYCSAEQAQENMRWIRSQINEAG